MGEAVITGLMPDQITHYQDRLRELIEKPLNKTGADTYYSADDVLDRCCSYKWQCWVACSEVEKIDCVFITHIDIYPKCKTFTIHFVGGEKIEKWLAQAWSIFKDYAKANNCKSIVGMGRKGWIKVLNKVEHNEFNERFSFSVEV